VRETAKVCYRHQSSNNLEKKEQDAEICLDDPVTATLGSNLASWWLL
jgi:hypothetical protein